MSEMCRLPAALCENMMEQAYSPDEIMAWALGYACRVLAAYSEFRKRKGMEVKDEDVS